MYGVHNIVACVLFQLHVLIAKENARENWAVLAACNLPDLPSSIRALNVCHIPSRVGNTRSTNCAPDILADDFRRCWLTSDANPTINKRSDFYTERQPVDDRMLVYGGHICLWRILALFWTKFCRHKVGNLSWSVFLLSLETRQVISATTKLSATYLGSVCRLLLSPS